jgi:putative hydrolase of the HAD superfamily
MKFKILLFDAAGVLFPTNKAVNKSLYEKFKISDESLSEMWSGIYIELSKGKINTNQFLNKFALMFNIPPDQVTEELFTVPFKNAIKPMPGMQELLSKLAKTKLVLALLSDTVKMYAGIRDELGYYKYFKKSFFSYKTGFLKPDPRAYKYVIDYYKIAPKEIFFIDDRSANVETALQLGMKGVVFEDTNKLTKVLSKEGIIIN